LVERNTEKYKELMDTRAAEEAKRRTRRETK
jgi:hypothetical protein